MIGEHSKTSDVLLELVPRVIEAGADHMEIEYKNGREEVFAVRSGIGVGIASLDSKSEEARLLREELYDIAKKKRVVRLSGCTYTVRVQIFDSFGEDAFCVTQAVARRQRRPPVRALGPLPRQINMIHEFQAWSCP